MIILIICTVCVIAALAFGAVASSKSREWDLTAEIARDAMYKQIPFGPEYHGFQEANNAALRRSRKWDRREDIATVVLAISGGILIICLLLIIITHSLAPMEQVHYEETYAALVAAEEGVMPHDFSVSSAMIEYNAHVRNAQRRNANPWLDWFVPDFYNDLPIYTPPSQ